MPLSELHPLIQAMYQETSKRVMALTDTDYNLISDVCDSSTNATQAAAVGYAVGLIAGIKRASQYLSASIKETDEGIAHRVAVEAAAAQLLMLVEAVDGR
jgi:hypothetical protein